MVGFELLLISAFFSALSSLLFALATKRLKYAEFAEVFLYVSLSLCFAGMLLLLHYLITDNFSIYYVYAYSQREMGFEYKIAALWAGKEGSLLLWAFASLLVTSIFTNYGVKDLRKAKALTVLTAINSFLLILILLSNPFEVLPFKYNNGIGMNPLLRTPEMIIHPPLVFFGYSLVACIYAGHLAEIENRGLVKLAWAFLTAGIVLGGFWAYRTLGWGGFWGWDPVENASLLPWLSLTAYLHARKGKEFFAYLSMVFVAFTAFVTRSGILSSSLIFGAMIVVVLLGTVANLFRSVDRSYYLITFTPIFFATAILTLYRLRSSTKKLIHLGVILLFIGATSVWFFESKETIILSPNGEVDGIEFYLQDVSSHWNPEKTVVKAKILSSIGSIEPEIHVYPQSTVSKAFILNTPLMDYYFAMKSAGSNFVEIEFYRVPLIALVWLGSALLLLGLISQKFRIRL
ncbi:MAG: cytochrome c-type biosis protein CcmF [Archaeoglobaceae archaeon]|nr:cytochrome c-type biosis protein CcmF [Archaeoglobaceae archaeon]